MDNVVTDQSSAVGTLLDCRGLLCVPHSSITSGTYPGNSSSIGSNGQPATFSSTKRSFQPSISTSFHNQQDICKCHNATLEFAIADLFHSENIPYRVVESARFWRVIKVARLCGDEFVCPDWKKIGGELLDLNFETRYQANKAALLKKAQTLGLAFLGDGATVRRMALLKILAMCANTPPITVWIQDCTTHMQDGGKKMHHILPVCLLLRLSSLTHNCPSLMCSSSMGLQCAEGWANIDGKNPMHILLPWQRACCIPLLFIHSEKIRP